MSMKHEANTIEMTKNAAIEQQLMGTAINKPVAVWDASCGRSLANSWSIWATSIRGALSEAEREE